MRANFCNDPRLTEKMLGELTETAHQCRDLLGTEHLPDFINELSASTLLELPSDHIVTILDAGWGPRWYRGPDDLRNVLLSDLVIWQSSPRIRQTLRMRREREFLGY